MRNPNTTCHECELPCYVRPNQIRDQKLWFCSRSCYNKNRESKLTAVCLHCNNTYRTRDSGRKYCGRSCSNLARRGIKYTGEQPNNKIGIAKRIRLMLNERDGEKCGNPGCNVGTEWNGLPLTLQIEHIDGNRKNNSPENLMYLCPNCHTQTETWAKPKARLNAL